MSLPMTPLPFFQKLNDFDLKLGIETSVGPSLIWAFGSNLRFPIQRWLDRRIGTPIRIALGDREEYEGQLYNPLPQISRVRTV